MAVHDSPELAEQVDGSGLITLAGQLDDALRVNGEVQVDRAEVFRLPLSQMRVPFTLS